MSKEKADFDTVYAEIEAELFGINVDDPKFEAAYSAYGDTLLAQERVDRPVRDTADTQISTQVIRHPFQEAWLPSDHKEIARIAYLGRQLIECAKTSLQDNPEWLISSEYNFTTQALVLFTSGNWFAAHPDIEYSPNYGRTTDAPSPHNLTNFPYGNYVNCLGVSIGLAATAELRGIPYVYANELRYFDRQVAENHVAFKQQIEKILPGIFENRDLVKMFDVMGRFNYGNEKKYAKLPLADPPGFAAMMKTNGLRDTHHYIVCPDAEMNDGEYAQLDPYGLIYGPLADLTEDSPELEKLPFNPSEVMIVEDDTVERVYRKLSTIVSTVREVQKKLCTVQDDTTYSELMAAVEAELLEFTEQELAEDPEEAKLIMTECNNLVSFAEFVVLLDALGMDEVKESFVKAIDERDYAVMYRIHHENVATVSAKCKYNRHLLTTYMTVVDRRPVTLLLTMYKQVLQYKFAIRNFGAAHPAMEISHPDFMIGAMYMNHYANYREDGRVNVARYLARYTPSQLIWQAAVIDGESEEDPSIQAVGEKVKNLKAARMHPRVALTVRDPSIET